MRYTYRYAPVSYVLEDPHQQLSPCVPAHQLQVHLMDGRLLLLLLSLSAQRPLNGYLAGNGISLGTGTGIDSTLLIYSWTAAYQCSSAYERRQGEEAAASADVTPVER